MHAVLIKLTSEFIICLPRASLKMKWKFTCYLQSQLDRFTDIALLGVYHVTAMTEKP